MRPLGPRILIKLLETKKESHGLILAGDNSPVKEAHVVAVPLKETELKAGDKVLVHSANILPTPEGALIPRDHILGVFE